MQNQPIIDEIKTSLTAPEAFELFRDRPYSFYLDSGMDEKKLGRYSFMGSDPFIILRSRGSDIELIRGEQVESLKGNSFDVLGELLAKYKIEIDVLPVPFAGGAVGYLAYDLCHFIERLPSTAVNDLDLPECYMGFYDAAVAYDHQENKVYIISTGFPEQGVAQESRKSARLNELKEILSGSVSSNGEANKEISVDIQGNFTHQQYLDAVQACREYIMAGDIFEVNLSQRFDTDLPIHSYELYRRLRAINPAPFACYLGFDGVDIVSASPERFISLAGDMVKTRPIKGTRPRGATPAEDEAISKELTNSYKDRAENVMIVDLERNDLGRVCRYGTVKVTELLVLEKYATVFQLVSTVQGRLCEGKNCIDLLKATFPGGSITGAPKVRSMEIIDELEPTRRSVYTGNVGYIGFNGDLDLNIAIRTFIVKDGRAYFQVGGAITYDSDPQSEYIETLDKAKALLEALGIVPDKAREAGKST
ncbi:MAG: aminodeoxychorismate synthase component I [Chloroflexi bacterium]|jgi:para-aminobenzoate synthetase component I|nr:aminodeoxychorismate synthase component I [Chloroflexota bacterium]MBT7082456.1 aminodeoxychorismate synthase component I [Chloroflexota bacterium]MBT7290039.1 aminodeoxychorismate synthase component I [Chloroflexota bacterium]